MKLHYFSIALIVGCLSGTIVQAQTNNPMAASVPGHIVTEGPGDGLTFIPNKGQWVNEAKYRVGLPEGALFLTNQGFVYSYVSQSDLAAAHEMMEKSGGNNPLSDNIPIHNYAYKVNFLGSNNSDVFQPSEKIQTYFNYFIGNDKSKWASYVPGYKRVTQRNIYNGIDLTIFGQGIAPEYDFIVAPNANPKDIQLSFEGITPVINELGQLHIKTTVNEVLEAAPVVYQIINGQKVNVPSKYKLKGNVVSFDFPQGYNKNYELVIDPTLVFCTYSGASYGGSGYYSYATTYGNDGTAFAGGSSYNAGWPVTTGAFQTNFGGSQDACINKYSSNGTSLVFSTFFGGSAGDHPHSLRVNSADELWVVGSTASFNLPTTTNAYKTANQGGTDIFVAHFDFTGGQLIGATYVGGSGNEPNSYALASTTSTSGEQGNQGQNTTSPVDIAFDNSGNAWVVGNTASSNFPVTSNAQQPTYGGGGTDGVIFKLDSTCSNLIYSSFLGGNQSDGLFSINMTSSNKIVVGGFSLSSNYPTTANAYHPTLIGGKDGVVTLISPDSGSILASTFLGTTSNDAAIVVQAAYDTIYVMGQTTGSYPISGAAYSLPNGNVFIDVLYPDLSGSRRSTKVGGGSYFPDGFMVDNCNNTYVAGLNASSVSLPTTNDAVLTSPGPFWFCVLGPFFNNLVYASYFGVGSDHTHVGINRMSSDGIVYHSICNAQQYPFITPGAWGQLYPGGGQDIVTFKFDFEASGPHAHISDSSGVIIPPTEVDSFCVPYCLRLVNSSTSPCHGMPAIWDPGDGTGLITSDTFVHCYDSAGNFTITLYQNDTCACIQWDTTQYHLKLRKVLDPELTISPDTTVCDPANAVPIWVNIANRDTNMVITWSPASAIITGTIHDDTIWVDPTVGTYTVRVVDSVIGLCSSSAMAVTHIGFFPRGVNILTPDTTVCKGALVPINATSEPGYTFSWSPATGVNDPQSLTPVITANHTETYTLTASHPDCVDTARTITITVEDYPVISLDSNKEVCQWDTVALTSNVSPYRSDYTYQWTPGNGLATTNQPNTSFEAQQSDWYYLNVSTPVGCSAKDSIHVTVFPGNFAAFSSDTGYCPPSTGVQIWADGGNFATYNWTPTIGLNNSHVADPIADPETQTTYTVLVTDVHGCKDTGSVWVSIYANAVLDMPDSVTIHPGETYHLQPGTNCVYFDWFPNSGINSAHVSDPLLNPLVRTRYYVNASTENGCTISDSIDVIVEGTVINMPNAFTPGDGVNNTFKPSKRGIAHLKVFEIYNRWGNKIFSTTNIDEGWDGTYKGKLQPTGVYVYRIEAVTDSGEDFVKSGNVTLLR